MKASVKLREDGAAPLLRAKLPVALFSVPAVASLTAGDPANLRLSLATAAPALPSLRLSYAPNRATSPLSLAVVLGSGPGGSPSSSGAAASAITMAVEVNTAGAVSFSLALKPSLGDFAVRKRFDSAAAGGGGGSGSSASAASEVTMRSAIPVRGGAAAVSVRWGVRIPAEVTAGGEEGAAALALRRLPFLVLGKVTVERRPPPPPASTAEETTTTTVEKTRRENERLTRELDELRAAATEKTERKMTSAAAGRRSSGWRSPEMAGDRKTVDLGR
ncbi:uncharacterized protein LOC127784938 [Oryza glaberrima]|uniref:Uncharacterized protein n=1 Tax=Oryza glaberrima TaxID=4538 RepID=I1QMK7_ORYGL|nr:uncharacterized protein LOC127784938 [Oryza glaberrima]